VKSAQAGGFRLPPRPRAERLLLGVCAGVASRYDLDVTLVRLAFLVLSLAWGLGILLYAFLWILTPTQGARPAGSIRGEVGRNVRSARLEVARSRRRLRGAWMKGGVHSSWPRPLDRRWLGMGMMGGGLVIVLWSMGALSWITPARAIGIAAIAGGIATLLSLGRRGLEGVTHGPTKKP